MMKPVVVEHRGVKVVRDDMFPGGTKARYIADLFVEGVEEIVYASPCQGGAQSALAFVARQLGKRATIFVAKRNEPHPRSLLARQHGATVYQVQAGYLSVLQARVRKYCEWHGAAVVEAPFGFAVPSAADHIASAARQTGLRPRQVWCAAGSGTLARGLMRAWPNAEFHLVQVGRDLAGESWPAQVVLHRAAQKFEQQMGADDFPSDPHYDAKAWAMCVRAARRAKDEVVFWNVTGPADRELQNGE